MLLFVVFYYFRSISDGAVCSCVLNLGQLCLRPYTCLLFCKPNLRLVLITVGYEGGLVSLFICLCGDCLLCPLLITVSLDSLR